MSVFKHRAWPGRLALACLLAGSLAISLIPAAGGRAIAATGPDLTIESIAWSPVNPALPGMVTFSTIVKNQGDCPADVSSCIAYYIDDSLVYTAYISPLEAGNSATDIFFWQSTAGDHNIKAVTDSNNAIAEINEDNNVIIYAFSVLAPDLIIESVSWSPEIASAGDTVAFTVTVKNQGNKISHTSWIDFFIDGVSRGQYEGERLEPGESYMLTYPWVARAGEHTLKASADVLSQNTESDETNNDLTIFYSTTPPDLVIESITWTPEDRTDTENITLTIEAKNQGAGAARGSWLSYYIDGVPQADVYINRLEAGDIYEETISWLVGPAEHAFTATIDANGWVFESDESNNTRSVILPAVGLPDLLIESITWTPSTPTINSRMTFTVTVRNAGEKAVNDCDIDLYAAYRDKLNGRTGPIAAGGTASADLPYFISTEFSSIRVIIDPDHFITESDEFNNEETASFVTAVPVLEADFIITSLTCAPENPGAGDTVTISATIKNIGTGTAAVSHVSYYLDGTLIGDISLARLASGAASVKSLTWTATIGSHTIQAIVDGDNYAAETDESNNAAVATISIFAPDLAIENITWSPEGPSNGETVNITVTVINRGSLESESCYVSYYVDGSYRGNHHVLTLAPGETTVHNFSCVFVNDTLSFKAIIDAGNSVIENDESNNERTAVIPDPAPEVITPPPADTSDNGTAAPVSTDGGDDADGITGSDDEGIQENDASQNPGATTASSEIPPDAEEAAITGDAAPGAPEDSADALAAAESTPAQDNTIPTDVPANDASNNDETATEETPALQNLLTNRWLIIGVAVAGIAGIFALLLMRKRAKTAKAA